MLPGQSRPPGSISLQLAQSVSKCAQQSLLVLFCPSGRTAAAWRGMPAKQRTIAVSCLPSTTAAAALCTAPVGQKLTNPSGVCSSHAEPNSKHLLYIWYNEQGRSASACVLQPIMDQPLIDLPVHCRNLQDLPSVPSASPVFQRLLHLLLLACARCCLPRSRWA